MTNDQRQPEEVYRCFDGQADTVCGVQTTDTYAYINVTLQSAGWVDYVSVTARNHNSYTFGDNTEVFVKPVGGDWKLATATPIKFSGPGDVHTVAVREAIEAYLLRRVSVLEGFPYTIVAEVAAWQLQPAVQFADNDTRVAESVGTTQVVVRRVGNPKTGAVSVKCVAAAGSTATSGSDYTLAEQTLSWAAGDSSSKSCAVQIIDDADYETSDEYVMLALQDATNATIAQPSTARVTIAAISDGCGDGVLAAGEACDDGNLTPGDGCNATCAVESGWSCPGAGACSPLCGDGKLIGSETASGGCDDGNTASGDGCSSACRVEQHYTCAAAGCTSVVPLCGDGVRVATELLGGGCDDGNTVDGDGCSGKCKVETEYFTCDNTTSPSVCTPTCGDGHMVGAGKKGEECDDGNTEAGDGCSSSCAVETGWYCSTPQFRGNSTCSEIDTSPTVVAHSSGMALVLSFRLRSNRAGQALFQPAPCSSYVLDATQGLMGKDCTAYWTSETELRLEVSADASVRVGTDLALRETPLGMQALKLYANGKEFTPRTRASVLAAPDSEAPKVSLSAPSTTSRCLELQVDAAVENAGVFPLAQVRWSVSALSVPTQLSDLLSAATSAKSLALKIPASMLENERTYTFSVSVKNWMTTTERTVSTAVSVSTNTPPTVSFLTQSFTTRVGSVVDVEADAFLQDCGSSERRYDQVSLSWSMDGTSMPACANTLSCRVRMASVGTRNVKVVAISTTGTGASSSATVGITAQASDLVARIVGGSRKIAIDEEATLSAASSFDPDSTATQLQYAWKVRTPGSTQYVEIMDAIPGSKWTQGSPNVVFPANTLQSKVAYQFRVTVTSKVAGDTRSATADVQWTTTASLSTSVSIAPLRAAKVSNRNFVPIVASVTGASTVVWSVTRNGVAVDVSDWASMFASPQGSPHLVVLPYKLSPGQLYEFTAAAGAASASLQVPVNDAPSGGSCSASPASGVALTTSFRLSCSGWRDSDSPIRYTFTMKDEVRGQYVAISGAQTEASLETILPPTQSGNVTLRVFITDSLRSITTYDLVVAASAPDLSDMPSRALALETNHKQMRPEQVSLLLLGYAAALNGEVGATPVSGGPSVVSRLLRVSLATLDRLKTNNGLLAAQMSTVDKLASPANLDTENVDGALNVVAGILGALEGNAESAGLSASDGEVDDNAVQGGLTALKVLDAVAGATAATASSTKSTKKSTPTTQTRSTEKVLQTLSAASATIAAQLVAGAEPTKFKGSAIEMEMRKVANTEAQDLTVNGTKVAVPSSALQSVGTQNVVLETTVVSSALNRSTNGSAVGDVMRVKMFNDAGKLATVTNLAEPITITLPQPAAAADVDPDLLKCKYFDTAASEWKEVPAVQRIVGGSRVIECATSHLTDFAVVWSFVTNAVSGILGPSGTDSDGSHRTLVLLPNISSLTGALATVLLVSAPACFIAAMLLGFRHYMHKRQAKAKVKQIAKARAAAEDVERFTLQTITPRSGEDVVSAWDAKLWYDRPMAEDDDTTEATDMQEIPQVQHPVSHESSMPTLPPPPPPTLSRPSPLSPLVHKGPRALSAKLGSVGSPLARPRAPSGKSVMSAEE